MSLKYVGHPFACVEVEAAAQFDFLTRRTICGINEIYKRLHLVSNIQQDTEGVVMATLKDVARLANVDVSTVSRALNNSAYVHPDTKAKIFVAVKKLSYQPNLLAKGLRQGKRNTIGVVVPSIKLTIFGEIAQNIEIEARNLGYGVMICNTMDDPDQEVECLNRLRNGFVDGIIIASTGQNTRLIRDIRASGISVVQLVRAQDKTISSVVADYRHCAYQGVKHLLKKGCKHIGFINGSVELIPYKERYIGYAKAMKEAKQKEAVSKSEVPRYDNYMDGYKGANYLLDKHPALDGVLTAVDMQGLGVLRAIKERGLRVPDDVRVISLTGHSIGGMLETSMTSMEMPAKVLGQRIAQMVVKDIEAETTLNQGLSIKNEVFKTALVERETT